MTLTIRLWHGRPSLPAYRCCFCLYLYICFCHPISLFLGIPSRQRDLHSAEPLFPHCPALQTRCAFFFLKFISMFIGSTSEIDRVLPSQLFAVKTDSVIHPTWEEKKKCTQTKRKSFWRNRCFRILICDLITSPKKIFYKYFTQLKKKLSFKIL